MAKAIMIQGTMSNAGKSLIAAGLCRIFRQDGYRVAPFKSQNMALNSFITTEGLEMGRAQVTQAEAAGVEPSVLMNPILLKPTNDVGSQVIVNGEVRGNMSARDYFRMKRKLIPDILKAYQTLDEAYDIIVIEGAGSPAEINLKTDDIVNMGMAKMAKAPVLLVGDIDRGGVFAQLYGTVALLEAEEKELVKGIIINKFRGDKTILDPGIAMLEELCAKPVVGVTPYMDVDLEDEDSLSERMSEKREVRAVDIAVIRLPRISNFTDFDVFERIEGVSLRYVSRVEQLGSPDMVILPGTKNTMADLRWLRQSGLEAAVLKAKERGCVIFGVCGGYQMLGRSISDPQYSEEGGRIRGMGLLPIDTEFSGEKTRTRVSGRFEKVRGALEKLSGLAVSGYEIHMGQTAASGRAYAPFEGEKAETFQSGSSLLYVCDSVTGRETLDGTSLGDVYGSYVHGIFDEKGVAETIVQALAARKGVKLSDIRSMDYAAYKETQYDKLAKILRAHLDMPKIYEILNEGVEV